MSADSKSAEMPVEKELKWKIADKDGWDRLRLYLYGLAEPEAELEQSNIYMHTADGISAARGTLRLRYENGRWLFTYKCRISGTAADEPSGYHQHIEIEDCISSELAEEILRGGEAEAAGKTAVGEALLKIGCRMVFSEEGRMRNIRLVWPLRSIGIERPEKLELDRTFFDGSICEYELELETADPENCRRLAEKIAQAAGIAIEPQARSKYARFLEYSGRQRGGSSSEVLPK